MVTGDVMPTELRFLFPIQAAIWEAGNLSCSLGYPLEFPHPNDVSRSVLEHYNFHYFCQNPSSLRCMPSNLSIYTYLLVSRYHIVVLSPCKKSIFTAAQDIIRRTAIIIEHIGAKIKTSSKIELWTEAEQICQQF